MTATTLTEYRVLPNAAMQPNGGLAWFVPAPAADLPPGNSTMWGHRSTLRLYEDGREIGPPHGLLSRIRTVGGGRFSHWLDGINFSTPDGSDPRSNGRVYSVRFAPPPPRPAELADLPDLARRLAADADGAEDELCARALELDPPRRALFFHWLALDFGLLEHRELAAMQALRAWNLGHRSRDTWHLMMDWAKANLPAEENRALIFASAAAAADDDDAKWMSDTVQMWEAWCHQGYVANHSLRLQDEAVAGPSLDLFARLNASPPAPRRPGPLRIGYVLSGEAEQRYCSLPEIACELAAAHAEGGHPHTEGGRPHAEGAVVDAKGDGAQAWVFSLRDAATVDAANPFFSSYRRRLDQAGVTLSFLGGRDPWASDHGLRLVAQDIAALDLDVLVFITLGGIHGLLAAMRPARAIASLGLGEVHLFTSKAVDLSVHFGRKPAMDGFSPSARAPLFIPPQRIAHPPRPVTRSSLGLPEDALVVVSSARPVKFHEPAYWRIATAFLTQRPDAWLMLVGIDDADLARLRDRYAFPEALCRRMRCLGWRNDHQDVLAAGDIFLDNYPNANAYGVIEALHAGLAAVVFRESLLLPFAERTWAHITETLTDYEGSADNNEDSVLERLLCLADDPAARARAIARGRAHLDLWSRPHPTAAAMEDLFAALLAKDVRNV